MTALADITVACGNTIPPPSAISFSNELFGGCLITGTSNPSTFTATPGISGGNVTETWTATDVCGRGLSLVSRIITIDPYLAPIIIGSLSACAGETGYLYNVDNVPGHLYFWSVFGGTITSGQNTNSIIVTWGSAGIGTVTITEVIASNGCSKTVSLNNIVINALPATPTIGTVTQPNCFIPTGSIVLNGLPVIGNWVINPGNISGSGTSVTISGISVGTYSFTVTDLLGCTSFLSSDVVINNLNTLAPNTPTLGGVIQPTCTVSTGSVVIYGLPAFGTWIITRSPGGVTYTGTGLSTVISGLPAGTYSFAVTNLYGCNSLPTANVVINIPPSIVPNPPAIGEITNPSCTVSTGGVVLNDLPASGVWTLTSLPSGTIITGSGSSKTIIGLNAGMYNYTVTNSSGCTSLPSNDVVINIQPTTPNAPTVGVITQPTCAVATGSVVLSDLPAVGVWTLTRTPGYVTTTGTGTSTTITGLSSGYYTYVVSNSFGCSSFLSDNIYISTQPLSSVSGPVVESVTQPACGADSGSVVLGGLPVSGVWTIEPGGIQGTGSSTTITLSSGTYSFGVTNSSGCSSISLANVVINTPYASTPTIGTIVQPTCLLTTGSVVLNGLPAGGMWTINPGGITGSGTSHTITGLASGVYSFTVTNASGCVSYPTANVVINSPQNSTPTAPLVGTIINPTCAVATGTIVLTGLPSSGTWVITKYPGGTTYTGAGLSKTITGLLSGSYTFTVTNTAGCTSVSSANAVINAQPQTPTAPVIGTITQPSCSVATGSVVLNGLPATGSWTLTKTPGGVTTTGTGVSKTITALTTGNYTYTVTNSTGCISSASASIVINIQPSTPTAPTIGAITQPTCFVNTGSVIINGLPATGTWTLTRSAGGAITGAGTSAVFAGLPSGTCSFKVTNAGGCTSGASANVIISAQPATPTAPTIGTITQPTCTVATGSVVLSGLPAIGTWTLTRSPDGTVITGTGTSKTVTGLLSGTYSFTVMNSVGCTSTVSADIVINAQPSTPTAPIVGTITQPSCTVSSGSVILNGLPAIGWTLTRTPGAITTNGTGTSTTITGLALGTYTYKVTSLGNCISPISTSIVINAQPASPATPVVGLITQPTCAVATGKVVLSGLPLGGWIINPGNISGSAATTTINNLTSGTYNFTVTNLTGCTSVATSNVLINPQPMTPTAPIVLSITQPTYTLATASVLFGGLPSGTWSLNPGAIIGSTLTTTVSGLPSGAYDFTVTNSVGCTSSSVQFVINKQPTAPSFGSQSGGSNNNTSGVIENSKEISIRIAPNPSNGYFNISFDGLDESASFSIYNMSGQVIYSEQIPENAILVNKPIDLKDQPKGMYFIRLISKNYSHIEKIIIE